LPLGRQNWLFFRLRFSAEAIILGWMEAAVPILAVIAAVLVGLVGARELAAGLRCGLARHRNGQLSRLRQAAGYWSLLSCQALFFLGATTCIYLALFSL
jgi:hypothetical protein